MCRHARAYDSLHIAQPRPRHLSLNLCSFGATNLVTRAKCRKSSYPLATKSPTNAGLFAFRPIAGRSDMIIHINPSEWDLHLWIGIPFSLVVFGLVVYCFRQGFAVKPDSSSSPRSDGIELLFPPR